MSIENVVNGFRIVKDAKGAGYIGTVERRFQDLYRVKHFQELLDTASSTGKLEHYFERRDQVFERYCSINYGQQNERD